MITFWLYDRWGNQIGALSDILSAHHKDEINGEDSLTFEIVGCNIEKGQRVVWRDKFSVWHEHIINDFESRHESGMVITSAYCDNSIAELTTDYIVEREPRGAASVALTRALTDTRWTVGIVDVIKESHTSWYHISVYEALQDIVEKFGGELYTTIEVSGGHVVNRYVNLVNKRGTDTGHLFRYSYNLNSVTRTINTNDVYTALYGYGKGLEKYDEDGNATGGYSRKLTFGDINNGNDWIGDDEARLAWGLPDGKGGIKHTFGQVEFSDCEDMEELLELTKNALKEVCKPNITYTGDVINLANGGFDGNDAQTGDTVYLRDESLDERLKGRVLSVDRDLITESETVFILGSLQRNISGSISDLESSLKTIKDRSKQWDDMANLDSSYVNAVINNWNNVINVDGGFVYWDKNNGITVYDKAINDAPTKAIQLKGGSFRIANSRKSDGDWNWSTIGTGDGFTADCLIAGTIRGGSNYLNLETGDWLFTQGSIGDVEGLTYWDITNKAFVLTEPNGKGIVYRDGKLTIDAESVYIGASTVQNHVESYTDAAIKVVNDSITSTVKQIEKDVDGQLTALESRIEQTIDGISLSVTNGKIGQTASITLTVDGEKKTQNIDLKNGVRSAFANDTSQVTINGGKITFNSGTIVINSTNFTVDANGKITAKSGTIGKFNITDKALYSGSKSTFNSSTSGVYLADDGISLGSNFKVTNAGELTASKGKIANFTLESTKLYSGSKSSLSANATGVYIGSDGIALGGKSGSDNLFSVTSAGALTAMSGKIGGYTIVGQELRAKGIRLGVATVDMYSGMSGFHIGSFCGCYYSQANSWRYLAMQSGSNGADYGLVFSIGQSANATAESHSTATVRAMYSKSQYPTNTGSNFIAGWNFWGNVSFHGGTLSDYKLASTASLSIGGTIKDQMNFIAVTKINDDGTIAEYVDGCSLEFENGLLVDMVKPEEE